MLILQSLEESERFVAATLKGRTDLSGPGKDCQGTSKAGTETADLVNINMAILIAANLVGSVLARYADCSGN